MVTVDFVYDTDCPNIRSTRANLLRAFSIAGVPARWSEHGVGDPDGPNYVRGYGSPTVLINGVDVADATPSVEACCRLYDGSGTPSVELIAARLRAALTHEETEASAEVQATASDKRWWKSAAVIPGLGVAVMPKIVCPLCWPAYSGVLSALGLSFLMEDQWLLPISAVFLLMTMGALLWRAKSRWGYGPAWLGAFATVGIMSGKFAFELEPLTYSAIGALIIACVWNAWPRRMPAAECSACQVPAAQ